MVRKRYYRIRDSLISHHQGLYKAAKARGESTCPETGEPLIDLSQENFEVLAALSREELLVRNSTCQNIDNEKFILNVDPDTDSVARRSVATKTF
jgi:hypothetical protein